jgi:N-acetylmuramoyl-L-alanine amidase
MSTIYLNPSIQSRSDPGSEEEQHLLNQIADAMAPFLRVNGIKYVRSKLRSAEAQVIRESNSEYYDLHLTLHLNASPVNLAGRLMGTDIFYFTYGSRAKRAAEVFADNFKLIYHNPTLVKAVPTTQIAEITKTKAPAILMEIAYYDNREDLAWLESNIDAIALNLVESLTRYFSVPFIGSRMPEEHGVVKTESGRMNLYRQPDAGMDILAKVPNNALVVLVGRWNDWYVAEYNGVMGYALAKYITVK